MELHSWRVRTSSQFHTTPGTIYIVSPTLSNLIFMESTFAHHPVQGIPKNSRKELLRTNIRTLIERTSLTRLEERKTIEENLKRITSLEIMDPEIEIYERERMDRIEEAKELLREVEETIDREMQLLIDHE